MPIPNDDRLVSIRVRDLAVLLIAAWDTGPLAPPEYAKLAEAYDSYGTMLTRMNGGSESWKGGA